MNLSLSGKRAIIGGSTQGIGLAIARELALQGASCTLLARNEASLKEAVASLDAGAGQQHDYRMADFHQSEQLKAIIETYVKDHDVHILINNSGGPASGPITDAETTAFLQAFNQHLICNHILVQAIVPGMKSEGFGRIINVISTSVKQPIAGLGVSNTIRAAVANWSKTLASELGIFGITVNNVLPGFTNTIRADYVIKKKAADTGKTEEEVMKELIAEIPVGRIGEPEEFGAAVA